MDLTKISEFESNFNPALLPGFAHIDINLLVRELEETHIRIREQLPRGPIYSMRSELKRLKSLQSLAPSSTWSPKELASAGFFYTGLENSAQCFCCGLVLCKQSLSATPIENHRKFNPNCPFIQGADSGNIPKYDIRLQPMEPSQTGHIESMTEELTRIQSFLSWPTYALVEPSALAEAGFFFTGTRDTVQCFSCGGSLGNWEENDDPWKEHAKWFPECEYLQRKKSKDDIHQYTQNYGIFQGFTGTSFLSLLSSHLETSNSLLFTEVETLKKQLTEKYSNSSFHNASPFGDLPSIDLRSLYADISVVLKDTRNQPIMQLTLPDILSGLGDITMIEGEAGSGKTALLKKIAILWASGKCPILNRFSLVFYISASFPAIENQQSLHDIICQQLIGSTSLSETSLEQMIKELKNKVLFLLDQYGIVGSIPKAIEELILKNTWNRVTLAVTVTTDKSRELRHCANTILSVQKFPLYSTMYLVKNIFLHDIDLVRTLLVELETSKNLTSIFQSPLMILCQCSTWMKYPQSKNIGDVNLFKTYLANRIVKFSSEDGIWYLVSSCGELALKGLFQSKFKFSDDDLRAAGVSCDKAIKYGFLSKFTAQRLQSTYMFFDPSFQEFLAGKRLSELLESEDQRDLDKGFYYLQHLNTFLKLIGPYRYLLKYASRNSIKATKKIMTYLFTLYDKPEALDCHLDSSEHLQRHPQLEIEEKVFIMTAQGYLSKDTSLVRLDLLMTFAVEAALESQCLPECAPLIMQFITGKAISFSVSALDRRSSESILTFIENYPESISLFSCVSFSVNGTNKDELPDFSSVEDKFKSYGIPTVEDDYSSAFLSLTKTMAENQAKVNQSNQFYSLFPKEIQIPDSVIHPFISLKGYKAAVFKVNISRINSENFSQLNCNKFQVLFSISNHIELHLNNCRGVAKLIAPALTQFLASFRKLVISNIHLSEEEQGLILNMTSLESLEIESNQESNYPDLIIRGIHNFPLLNELSLKLPKNTETIDHLPHEFTKLNKLRNIELVLPNCGTESARFVQFIHTFRDLQVLRFSFKNLLDFNGLMESITTCKKLTELNLCGSVVQDSDISILAAEMKNLTSLEVLNLDRQKIIEKDTADTFAVALGSLIHLKRLYLPAGQGMAHAANRIIEQFRNLSNLQFLAMKEILDDESIALLADTTRNHNLINIQQLELQVNTNITESGWRTFFERSGHMPELSHLNISRMYTQQIKSHATTVTSFVRFVSRLPRLVNIVMYGWLLDKDDLNMFNTMKENHPQSKSLTIVWQWFLPFSPTIEK